MGGVGRQYVIVGRQMMPIFDWKTIIHLNKNKDKIFCSIFEDLFTAKLIIRIDINKIINESIDTKT